MKKGYYISNNVSIGDNSKPPVVFILYRNVQWSGPIQNSAVLWHRAGYDVTIYWLDEEYHSPRESDSIIYKSIPIQISRLILFACKIVGKMSRILKRTFLAKIGLWLEDIIYLVKSFYFCAACFLKTKKTEKYILIAYDPQSLFAANLIARFNPSILVYWSSELWMFRDIKQSGRRLFKYLEMKCNQNALCTIEFGDTRCELLRAENSLAKESMISIPNAPLGEARIERNYYFNEKFDIPLDRKIILYAGSLAIWSGLDEVLTYIHLWPPDCVFIMHSKSYSSLNMWKEIIAKKRGRVFLSSDPVPFRRLSEIYSSADIGLQVFWKPRSFNTKYPDLSSGKLFHYLQFGVPVIARELEGYHELIEKSGIGLCVSDMSQIASRIEQILANEAFYRNNCLRIFNKFKFEDYHQRLIHRVEETLYGPS